MKYEIIEKLIENGLETRKVFKNLSSILCCMHHRAPSFGCNYAILSYYADPKLLFVLNILVYTEPHKGIGLLS